MALNARTVLRKETISYLSSPGRPNGGGNQDNRGAGMGSRPARCIIRLVARPSGPVSKVIRPPVTLTKKFFSLSANISNLGPAMGWPLTCDDLCEEAVAVARDFENAVRRQLIAPRVVIEEPRINRNLGVLFWRLGIGKRQPSGSGDEYRCHRHRTE